MGNHISTLPLWLRVSRFIQNFADVTRTRGPTRTLIRLSRILTTYLGLLLLRFFYVYETSCGIEDSSQNSTWLQVPRDIGMTDDSVKILCQTTRTGSHTVSLTPSLNSKIIMSRTPPWHFHFYVRHQTKNGGVTRGGTTSGGSSLSNVKLVTGYTLSSHLFLYIQIARVLH